MQSLRSMLLVSALVVLCVGCGGDDDDDDSPASGGAGGTDASLCEQGCVATMQAACSNGPSDQAQCEADCEALASGACATEYQALQACAQGEPITCDTNGLPAIVACTTEQTAFVDCLN